MAECMAEFTKKLLGAGGDSGAKEGEEGAVDKESLPSMGEAQPPKAKGAVKKSCKACKAKLFRRRR